MNENKLTNKQIKTVAHYLTSVSIEEACKKSSISKTTFYEWMKNDDFRQYVEGKRKEIIEGALSILKIGISKAVSVLIQLTSSRDERIRRLRSM